jgi:hypothetical protein
VPVDSGCKIAALEFGRRRVSRNDDSGSIYQNRSLHERRTGSASKALNQGRNGISDYSPPEQGREQSDDWKNDVSLLAKFLKDLRDILSAVIQSRIPERRRKGFAGLLANLQCDDIDTAIDELNGITGPEHSLFGKLEKVGRVGEALLVKLDEFRDRILNGPILAVLGIGDTILG